VGGVLVLEAGPAPGGLARTMSAEAGGGRYHFDLGGHRFLTADAGVQAWVEALLGPELLRVTRRSTILKAGRHFAYPLEFLDALAGVGPLAAAGIVASYARQRLAPRWRLAEPANFEDWVVARFGRDLFARFFAEYSEKVWGLTCRRLGAELAAQRIGSLSLGGALRRAVAPGAGGRGEGTGPPDSFLYPAGGIGRLAERLAEEIAAGGGEVRSGWTVERVLHDGRAVLGVTRAGPGGEELAEGGSFISTIPLTELVARLEPRPPAAVLAAARGLRYRDLIVVALCLDRPRVSAQTWIYLPERSVPFGRLHEPANWSPALAPAGRTALVAEYFCFQGDRVWASDDQELLALTAGQLARLGLIRAGEVLGGRVVRVPRAYPIPQAGQAGALALVKDHLAGLANLRVIGRTGGFQYLNMDEVIRQGIDAAAGLAAGAGHEGREGRARRRA
jgi:protoporphyrinogen oxidase